MRLLTSPCPHWLLANLCPESTVSSYCTFCPSHIHTNQQCSGKGTSKFLLPQFLHSTHSPAVCWPLLSSGCGGVVPYYGISEWMKTFPLEAFYNQTRRENERTSVLGGLKIQDEEDLGFSHQPWHHAILTVEPGQQQGRRAEEETTELWQGTLFILW